MHEASEKLARAVCSLFSKEINETLTAIHATLDEQDSVNIRHDAFRTALRALIHRHTWQQSHRLFVYEFHAYRRSIGLPVDPNSSEAFDAFRETLDEQVRALRPLEADDLDVRPQHSELLAGRCPALQRRCSRSHELWPHRQSNHTDQHHSSRLRPAQRIEGCAGS